jgi:hypothetical protein
MRCGYCGGLKMTEESALSYACRLIEGKAIMTDAGCRMLANAVIRMAHKDPAPQQTNEQHGDSGLTGSVPAAVSGTDFQITRPAQPGQNLLTASSNEDHAAGAARGKGDTPESDAHFGVGDGTPINWLLAKHYEFAQGLERQRDAALAKLAKK